MSSYKKTKSIAIFFYKKAMVGTSWQKKPPMFDILKKANGEI